MPLYKGNTKVGAIYKGTTQYSKVYKGSTLVFESAKWLPYYYEYLYHDLVPTTIDSKNVKNKAKVATIYGNSVVENQLVRNGNFENTSEWTMRAGSSGTQSVSNNVLTLTFGGTNNGAFQIYQLRNFIAGHKYLLTCSYKLSTVASGYNILIRVFQSPTLDFRETPVLNTWRKLTGILEMTNTGNFEYGIYYTPNNLQDGDSIQFKDYEIIDLTQMFPFDTPTTLTDNRVQAILNKGYIPYNTGEIKNTDIGEIESEGYNIWDEETELGSYSTSTGEPTVTNSQIRAKNDIELVGGLEYQFNFLSSAGTIWGCLLDENKIIIPPSEWSASPDLGTASNFRALANSNIGTCTFTAPHKAKYLRFYFTSGYGTTYNNNVWVHRTGTRTGYAPYDDFVDLAHFNPIQVGTVQDKFLATDNGYVFTKKVGTYTFSGNETWSAFGPEGAYFCSQITGVKQVSSSSSIGNIIGTDLTATSQYNAEHGTYTNSIAVRALQDNTVVVYLDSSITSGSAMASAMAGKTIWFELATPQTISMPLRHLGMVDLGTLAWQATGTDGRANTNYSFVSNYNAKQPQSSEVPNIYCMNYKSERSDYYASSEYAITIAPNGLIYLRNKSLLASKTASEVAELLSGIYLYYETNDVVDETDVLTYKGIVPLKYQGSGVGTAHDTMEIGKENVVFTKRMATVDLGSYNYNYSNEVFNCDLGNIKTQTNDVVVNALCQLYLPVTRNDFVANTPNMTMRVDNNQSTPYLYFRNTTYTSTADFKTAMSGVPLQYELATPQAITIPRKHLGIIDLGSLEWEYDSNRTCFRANLSSLKHITEATVPNAYCIKYMVIAYTYNVGVNNIMFIYADNNVQRVFIRDSSLGTNATDFKNAMAGLYLFYETSTEVADMLDTIDVEAGGTLTSNWFSWVENQLADVNFSTTTRNDVTITNLGNGSFELNGTASSGFNHDLNSSSYNITTHTYLICAKVSEAINQRLNVRYASVGPYIGYVQGGAFNDTDSQTGLVCALGKPASGNTNTLKITVTSGASFSNLTISNLMYFDLTLGFGAGNEPTSTADPRIQQILSQGYIPTNTTGTNKSVDPNVLPNAQFKFKCK